MQLTTSLPLQVLSQKDKISQKEKDKEKANVIYVIIDEPSYIEDVLSDTIATNHAKVNDTSICIHSQDMQITKERSN